MTSRRPSTVLNVIGIAVATVAVLSGCTAPPAVESSDFVSDWVSDTGSTIQLASDGHARFTNFPRSALRLEAVGAPVSGTASWRTVDDNSDGDLVSFVGEDLRWSDLIGASWTATLTDDSPRRLVFALSDPGLETSKELVLQRRR